MKHLYKFLILSIVLCIGLVTAAQYAHAQIDTSLLFVSPERLSFPAAENNQPVTRLIHVTNKSNKIARFDVRLEDYMMGENGDVKRVEEFKYSARPFLRYTPKRFTLKPNERLAVRVMFQQPEDLADGDYHAHLLFREIPSEKKEHVSSAAETGNKVQFEINTIYGIGVPIVVQKGMLSSRLTLAKATLTDTVLSTVFERSGNAEALGSLSVSHVVTGQEPVNLLPPQLIRMYHEVDRIERKITLPALKDRHLFNGELVLTLTPAPESSTVADVQEIRLPLK